MICEYLRRERERKTLETLLASRLDDRTILFARSPPRSATAGGSPCPVWPSA